MPHRLVAAATDQPVTPAGSPQESTAMSITTPRASVSTPAELQTGKQTGKQAAKAARAAARAEKRAEQDRLPAGHRPLLPRLGGAALIAAPFLFIGGSLTSPPQDSASNQDYIISLARDHSLTALSA